LKAVRLADSGETTGSTAAEMPAAWATFIQYAQAASFITLKRSANLSYGIKTSPQSCTQIQKEDARQ